MVDCQRSFQLVATVLTVYGIETILDIMGMATIYYVATVLTVYGIETQPFQLFSGHGVLQQYLPFTVLKP